MPTTIIPAPELHKCAGIIIAKTHSSLARVTILWGWTQFDPPENCKDEDEAAIKWLDAQKPVRVNKVNPADVVLLGERDQDQPVFRILVPQAFFVTLVDAQVEGFLDYVLSHIYRDDNDNWRVERDAFRVLFGPVQRGADLTWIESWNTFLSACARLAPREPELSLFTDDTDRQGYRVPAGAPA